MTIDRYQFRGLYCPKAEDFLVKGEEPNVQGFLEQCCVRLERLFPEIPHAASLAGQMRHFGKRYEAILNERREAAEDAVDKRDAAIQEKDQEIAELEDEIADYEVDYDKFDMSLPV
jgi:hypothetical protein